MLRQKSLLAFTINLTGSLLGFISVLFVSRLMGPEAMGAISSSVAFAGLFALFGDFGFGIAHYKKVSEGQDLGKCIGTFLVIRIVTTIIMGVVTLIVFYGTHLITGKYPVDAKYINVFYIVFISGLIGNLLYVITYTFTARVEKAKEGVSIISQKFVNSILKIVVAVSGLGIVFLAWSNLAGVVAGTIVSLFLFWKYPIAGFDRALFKTYFLFALPAIMIGVTETISMNIDKVFISYFSGTEAVGYYSSSQSLILIISSVGAIFISLLLPTYSALHAQGKMEEIKNMANRVERYISILLMPVVFFVFFFADPVRQIILGNRFEPSTPIISILVLYAMVIVFNQPYSTQLLGTNQIKLGMILGLVMLAINIILNLLLIPSSISGIQLAGLGGLGAAFSLLISSFIGTLLFRYFAFKTSGSRPNYKIIIHLICAVLSFGGIFLVSEYLSVSNCFIPVYFLLGSGVFLLLMALFGEFTKEEFHYYLNMLNPRLMKNYIRDEFRN
jgi:O-antigen/teichoic acid export membrane protein